jgi:hypothetical protein
MAKTHEELVELAIKVRELPNAFFLAYDALIDSWPEEKKEKVRMIMEPEAKRRGLKTLHSIMAGQKGDGPIEGA